MKTLTILLTLIFAMTAYAEVINVPDDHETIQGAIDAAEDGDTVLVAPGTYVENIDIDHDLTLASYTLTTGRRTYIHHTIIDGNNEGTTVVVHGDAIVVTGFKIVNGGGEEDRYTGCGVYVVALSGTVRPTLRHLLVAHNSSTDAIVGGGITAFGALIEDVSVIANENENGVGGIYIGAGMMTTILHRVDVNHNSGGGIKCVNTTPEIRNSLIKDNQDGFGINCFGSNLTLINSTVVENGEEGLFLSELSHATVVNSIFWDNPIFISLPGFRSSVSIAFSDVQGGEEGIEGGMEEDIIWGDGNIDDNPLFAERDSGYVNLSEDSPCIDSGTDFFVWEDDTLVNLSDEDYIGEAPDMGGREYNPQWINPDSKLSVTELTLQSIHPNPFNSTTTISYSIPQSQQMKIKLHDISGRLVETLYEGHQAAGHHSAVWDSRDFGAGIYFVKIQTETETKIAKLVAIK